MVEDFMGFVWVEGRVIDLKGSVVVFSGKFVIVGVVWVDRGV